MPANTDGFGDGICVWCGEMRESEVVCQRCGAVRWRPPFSASLTANLLIAGAFAGRDYFGPTTWVTVGFWVLIVLGGLWTMRALGLWYEATRGPKLRAGSLIGAAMLFGFHGWLLDTWPDGGVPGKWAIMGACGASALVLIGWLGYRQRGDTLGSVPREVGEAPDRAPPTAVVVPPEPSDTNAAAVADEAILDAVLEKLGRSGHQSLSPEERELLIRQADQIRRRMNRGKSS